MKALVALLLAILPLSSMAEGGISLAERFVHDRLSTNREPGVAQWYFRLHPATNTFISLPHVTGFKPGMRLYPVGVLERGATNRLAVPTPPGVNSPVEFHQIVVLAGRRQGWIEGDLFKGTQRAGLERDTAPYELYQPILGRMIQLEVVIPDEAKLSEIYGQ